MALKINVLGILLHLNAAYSLQGDAQNLLSSFTAATQDPDIKAELAANPLVAAEVVKISQDIRSVENDITAVKKSNFFTAIPRILHLAGDLQTAQIDAAGIQTDPALLAEIAAMPKFLSVVQGISAQWRKVENDVNALAGKASV